MVRGLVRTGMVAGTLIVLAATGEILLRGRAHRFRTGLEQAPAWNPEHACNEPDPPLVYRGIPRRCGANSRGYADTEHAFEKSPGAFRIVVIGDSIALGHPRAYYESFAHALERRLRQRCPGQDIEIIVLATVGYSSEQELYLLETEALDYSPDLVLWSYCLNDPLHPYRHDPNGQLGRYYHRPWSYLADFIAEKLFFVREAWRVRTRGCSGEFHTLLQCAYAGEIAAAFEAIGRWRATTKVPVAVLIHPLIQEHGSPDRYPFTQLHERLVRLADANDLLAVDVTPAYRGRSWQEIGVGHNGTWFDIYHPSRTGHDLVARFLETELETRGLLSCRSTPRSAPRS